LQPCNSNAVDKAEAVRAQIHARDPALLEVLDECKRVFGARLVAIDCGPVQRGKCDDPRYNAAPVTTTRSYQEQLEDWERQVAEQARAGAYKGAGFKRATASRRGAQVR
jgi:hypothetical protein